MNSVQLMLNFRFKVKVMLMFYLSKVNCLGMIIKNGNDKRWNSAIFDMLNNQI